MSPGRPEGFGGGRGRVPAAESAHLLVRVRRVGNRAVDVRHRAAREEDTPVRRTHQRRGPGRELVPVLARALARALERRGRRPRAAAAAARTRRPRPRRREGPVAAAVPSPARGHLRQRRAGPGPGPDADADADAASLAPAGLPRRGFPRRPRVMMVRRRRAGLGLGAAALVRGGVPGGVLGVLRGAVLVRRRGSPRRFFPERLRLLHGRRRLSSRVALPRPRRRLALGAREIRGSRGITALLELLRHNLLPGGVAGASAVVRLRRRLRRRRVVLRPPPALANLRVHGRVSVVRLVRLAREVVEIEPRRGGRVRRVSTRRLPARLRRRVRGVEGHVRHAPGTAAGAAGRGDEALRVGARVVVAAAGVAAAAVARAAVAAAIELRVVVVLGAAGEHRVALPAAALRAAPDLVGGALPAFGGEGGEGARGEVKVWVWEGDRRRRSARDGGRRTFREKRMNETTRASVAERCDARCS